LKIDHLITQFLYENKRLSLPGIGTFTADGGTIQYHQTADSSMSPELVEYVRKYTGKMYPLAQSDIESYIMLNKQFLNIGKALYMEGIGTLVKTRDGDFHFTPGEMITERMDDLAAETRKPSAFAEEPRYAGSQGGSQRWIIALIAILSIGLIVWGSWHLFLKNSNEGGEEEQVVTNAADTVAIPATTPDTSHAVAVDSVSVKPVDSARVAGLATPQNSQWRFVIEETNRKGRALRRFNQIKELGTPIRMETADSVNFKLYFVLPAMPADTARISDSLRIFYGSSKVKVEQ
jgi:hypothetical protein